MLYIIKLFKLKEDYILPKYMKQINSYAKDYNFSYSDYEIYDYEGKDFNATFDGYCLNLSDYPSAFGRDFSKIDTDNGIYRKKFHGINNK